MSTAIVTLLVGVVLVGASFLILDSHNYKEEDEIYNESSEELKRKITELCDTLMEQSKSSFDEYTDDIKKKKEKELKDQLDKYVASLSEKAKKEMIDYINQSLSEAYADYNPDAKEQPEPVTYEEMLEEEVRALEQKTKQADAGKTETKEKDLEEVDEEAIRQEAAEALAEKSEEEAEEKSNVVEFKNPETVIEEAEPEEKEATGTEPVSNTNGSSNAGNKSRKKNRKRNRTNRNQNRNEQTKKEMPAPEEIWDDEKNINEEVAALYKDGLGIMEIANQLGIGVGETKLIIKNIEDQQV